MTPSQLEHLRATDAHLGRLLDIAAKRTPGEWEVDQAVTWDQSRGINPQIVQRNAYLTADDATYIASCAGNAEAGWKATRAAIAAALQLQAVSLSPCNGGSCMVATDAEDTLEGAVNTVIESILAAFPLELIED